MNDESNEHKDNAVKRILIVDDHPMVRAGLCYLISIETDLVVCAEAEGMSDALKLVDADKPDMVIIDLSLSDGSGLDLIEHIKLRHLNIPMLVASMHDESLFAERVIAAGAQGYLNKREAPDKIIQAIRKVLSGKVYLSEYMTEKLLSTMTRAGQMKLGDAISERLSNRELTVFDLIGEGHSTREIASLLSLSIKTIETHQANIKKKLGLKSANELNRRAMQWHLERE